ncbi:MAG: hypothetical protein IPJ77_15195 [Planctomycetes bacterium]|nr:hypothetical protein [Planctomycetota bacterium]
MPRGSSASNEGASRAPQRPRERDHDRDGLLQPLGVALDAGPLELELLPVQRELAARLERIERATRRP